MKRYFTFATPPDPTKYSPRGQYHYLSLPGPLGDHAGGYVCVLTEESADVPADWVELPHLLDSSPAYFDGIQHVLGSPNTTTSTSTVTSAQLATPTTTVQTPAVSATIHGQSAPPVAAPTITNSVSVQPLAGIQVTHTTYQVAKLLASINRNFHP